MTVTPNAKRGKAKARGNGRGTIYPHTKGQSRLQFRAGGMVLASGIAGTRSEAEKAISRASADYERGTLTIPNRVTFKEYTQRWLARQKALAETTRLKYERELGYALEHLGDFKQGDLKPQHIKDALSHLADRPAQCGLGRGRTLSSSTLAGLRTRVRAVLREAVSDGLIPNDPSANVKRVKPLKTEHPGVALDFDQAARLHEIGEALHDAGISRLWCALFLCLSIGLRKGEAMGLQWQDIDLKHAVLTVRRNLTTPNGKPELRESAKTNAGNRTIFMPNSVKVALERHWLEMRAEAATRGDTARGETPVFATELGTYTHPDNLHRALIEILEWSNPEPIERKIKGKPNETTTVTLEARLRAIPVGAKRARIEAIATADKALPRISPHDLRHTAGTLMLRRGVPIEVVSKTLGHADIAITYRVYRHVLESERRAQVIDLFPSLPERSVQAVQVTGGARATVSVWER